MLPQQPPAFTMLLTRTNSINPHQEIPVRLNATLSSCTTFSLPPSIIYQVLPIQVNFDSLRNCISSLVG